MLNLVQKRVQNLSSSHVRNEKVAETTTEIPIIIVNSFLENTFA